jgi:hypothetical protein
VPDGLRIAADLWLYCVIRDVRKLEVATLAARGPLKPGHRMCLFPSARGMAI